MNLSSIRQFLMARADATYFLKAVQGFESKGISVYGVSIQVCTVMRHTMAMH